MDQSKEEWLWKGRHVYMFDGTTTLMPDKAAHQQAYQQTWNQKADPGRKHTYRVIAVNTVGLKSMPTADSVAAGGR